MNQEILNLGQQHLASAAIWDAAVGHWRDRLTAYRLNPDHPDEAYAWLTCALALKAVATGNFGVGCVLVDGSGRVVALGHNRVFRPYFRSDRHAEMVVMDDFEDAHPEVASLAAYTLYTSLEPCPMCLVRLSSTGLSRVVFVAADEAGGMVRNSSNLPAMWLELARDVEFAPARCSPDLAGAAGQIFLLNLAEQLVSLKARRGAPP